MAKKLIDLPIGAKVKDVNTTYYGKPIIWQVADKHHTGYPENSITLISEKILCLKCFDAKEINNPDEKRRIFGNGRYKHSNINKWLNSSGSWYVSQHAYDAPPTAANLYNGYNAYDNESGFLTGFSSNFKNAIKTTILTIERAPIDGGGTETVTAQIFLASDIEVGFKYKNPIENEYRLAMFSDIESRKARLTAEAAANSRPYNENAIAGAVYGWLLRSPYFSDSNAYLAHAVSLYDHGDERACSAFDGHGDCGIRPLCNLDADIRVSNTPDSEGVYSIEWNYPPQINISSISNLGIKNTPFSLPYTVSDQNSGQILTAKEFINGVQKRSYTVELGKNYSLKVTKEEWQEILNTTNTLKLVVEDDEGGKAEKNFTFSKNETEIEFKLKTPLSADSRVTKAIISIMAGIPEGAILTVEACNNGFDNSPTWEDVTNAVKRKAKIFLSNATKTASKWGFSIRVKVKRNGAVGECFISSIGGNYE